MNFNFDGVNIALQVDLSQNASLNHQDGIQLVHGFRSKPFITYAWIAKAVEDGLLCQRQLCHCLRSKETQVYVPVYLYMKTVCADLKASSLSFLLENICSSSNASCSQTSICGSKNISDANLESFSYCTWEWSRRH